MNIYLELEFSSGRLFEYSKTAKEGFEKYESSTNKISYRKYYAYGVFGVLQSITRRKNDFGELLSLYLIDKDKNSLYIKINMYDQSGGFTPYSESLLSQIASLEPQTGYKVQPYAIEKEGTKYKNYGISFKEADVLEEAIYENVEPIKKLSFSYYNKEKVLVEGDIPAVIWENKRDKWIANSEAKIDYLYEVMMAHTSDASENKGSGVKTMQKPTSKNESSTTTIKTKEKDVVKNLAPKVPKNKAEITSESEEDEDDDLPF